MLLELTTGRTRTAVGYERFARLSEMYVAHMISQGLTKILPPQDSLESFKGWCAWMVIDENRAREFETAIHQAAGYLKGTNRPAYASDPSVKLIVREGLSSTRRAFTEISMNMQLKYAGQQRSERVKRRKLTMMG